jgi:hypothetical protein
MPAEPTLTPTAVGPRWQQTAWGRILIGLILAQGLFYGLRHLVTAILLAFSGVSPEELAVDLRTLLVIQAIQLFALIVGGVMAGGGQRSGLVLGAVVGAWNGVLALFLRQNPAQELTVVGLYGQLLLHGAVGAIGGLVGSLIWKPPSATPIPTVLIPRKKVEKVPRPPLLGGRVSWLRVVLGATVSIGGTLSAAVLFSKMMDLSSGRLATSSALQDRIVTWEIKALALLVGGALAGSTAANGFKQGLIVALISFIVLLGLQSHQVEDWLELAFYTALSTFTLCTAGGWFGRQLFPPILKLKRRRGANVFG